MSRGGKLWDIRSCPGVVSTETFSGSEETSVHFKIQRLFSTNVISVLSVMIPV